MLIEEEEPEPLAAAAGGGAADTLEVPAFMRRVQQG